MVDNEEPEENLPCPTFDYTERLDGRCVRAFKVLKENRNANKLMEKEKKQKNK